VFRPFGSERSQGSSQPRASWRRCVASVLPEETRLAYDALRTLLEMLEVFRPALTRPGFSNLLVIFSGWVLTSGPHAITQALVVTGVAGRRHHEAFHRFFSRGAWSVDEMGRLLFCALSKWLPPDHPIRLVIDDTVAAHKGPKIFGLGTHLDAVRSTRAIRILTFGHCWVVLAVLVPVPFSQRPWALPILLRLYRNEKQCRREKIKHRKKTQLAREMIDVVLSWVDSRRVEVTADQAYCNSTVLRDLPTSVLFLGDMRPDAVLTAPPAAKGKVPGRPRVRGEVLPKPQALADDEKVPWKRTTAKLYGRTQAIYYKTLTGQWYRATGSRILRVVVVRIDTGKIGIRVFFSTDPRVSIRYLLEGYARRWSIEVCFRDIKQLLGFSDSSARKREAVERIAPLVALTYTTLTLWFAREIHCTEIATPPERPWYGHKQGLCFADILRAAQRTLLPLDVLDPQRSLDNLRESSAPACGPPTAARRQAA